MDNLPASSGVWCACEEGVWSANATGAPCSGLPAELYNNSKLSPPTPGQNCTQPEEYGDYGEIPSRGGQCWAQFCNPCGRMARSFCTAHPALHSRNATRLHPDTLSVCAVTDKFKLRFANDSEVPWEGGVPFPGEDGELGKYGRALEAVGERADGEAPLLNVRSAAQNELVTSADFITWMRAAILPRVRKLYRVIPGGLEAGTYTLEIRSNYDPLIFDSGTHRVLISTRPFFMLPRP